MSSALYEKMPYISVLAQCAAIHLRSSDERAIMAQSDLLLHTVRDWHLMRKVLIIAVLMAFWAGTVIAQNEDQETPNSPDVTSTSVSEAEILEAAEAILDEAGAAVDLAFNLLGLFEALSLAVTVSGVVLAAFGFNRFNQAQRELEETRQKVLDQFETYRKDFDAAAQAREEELNMLRSQLEATAESEREQTSNALLANALIPIAERQYKFSDYSGALSTYSRALELDKRNPVVHQKLGYVYTNRGDLDKAKYHYEQARTLSPDFAPALAGLGLTYRRLGEAVEKAIPKDASEEDQRNKRLERDRLYNEGERLLLQALELSPRLVDDDGESWWGVLGGLYKRRGQIYEAINAYKEATVVTPESSYGHGNLALLYLMQGQRDKMLQTYERVERIALREANQEQGNFWGYADLIVSSYAIGKSKQADEALPVAISIAPIDSPYTLSSLKDTLQELTSVLEKERVAPIENAIMVLDAEIERRANDATDAEDLEPASD